MRREFKVAAVSGAIILGLLATGPAQSLASSNTVFSDDIVDGQVTAADLNTGSVQLAEIAVNAVNSARIVDGSVTGADVLNNSLGVNDIAANAVQAAELAADAVSGPKVANNSLTGADINEGSLNLRDAHFAIVNRDGTKLAGDASATARTALGAYTVSFPVSMAGCAATAVTGSAPGSTGYSLSIPMIHPDGGNGFQLIMYKYDASALVDTTFHLTVICP